MDMLTSNSNLQSVRIILSGTSCQKQNDNLLVPVLFISDLSNLLENWEMRNAAMTKEVYKMAGICINHFQDKHKNKTTESEQIYNQHSMNNVQQEQILVLEFN